LTVAVPHCGLDSLQAGTAF